ncbi:MAG: hypothetical protein GX969_07985 [Firmicutes bacterium]|nr:hypothetical protein [Bacillota bacterium]
MQLGGSCARGNIGAKQENGRSCIICGRPSQSPVITVLDQILCLKCMETISKIDSTCENYTTVMERLKILLKPVLVRELKMNDLDKG